MKMDPRQLRTHKNQVILILAFFFCTMLSGQQSGLITQRYFKDPDVKFDTPTLSLDENRFATYEEILNWIESNIAVHVNASVRIIGTTPLGRDIPVIYLSNGSSAPKLRVWFQGLLHGNEPAGGEALLFLAKEILTTAEGENILDNLDIAILPIANIDGYIANTRRSSNGYDLNRDQTKFADPVSRIIKAAFISWQADLAFDFHEFQPTRREYAGIGEDGASISYDVLFLPSGYLNIPSGLRKASVDIFQKEAEAALERNGYTHNFYFTAGDYGDSIMLNKGAQSPHSSSTSYALSNAVSLLVETRGIGLGRTSFARRTHSARVVAGEFLLSALRHKEELTTIINEARNETLSGKTDVVVTSTPSVCYRDVDFIDLSDGMLLKLRMRVNDAENLNPEIVRPRPKGYIIEPGHEKEIEVLKLLGLEITQLRKGKKLKVQSYLIEKYEESETEWEGIRTASVSARLISQRLPFAKGSYYVDLRQKNANYVISVMEPEAVNGFVSYRVTTTFQGDTLPWHRIEERNR